MSASKDQLTEELKSLKDQQAQLAAQVNQATANLYRVSGAIEALESLISKHYAEDRIVLPSAQNVAAVAHNQRQSDQQKKALLFPVAAD